MHRPAWIVHRPAWFIEEGLSHTWGLKSADWRLGHRTSPTLTVSFPGWAGSFSWAGVDGEEQSSQNRGSPLSLLSLEDREEYGVSQGKRHGLESLPPVQVLRCHLLAALNLIEPSGRHPNRIDGDSM